MIKILKTKDYEKLESYKIRLWNITAAAYWFNQMFVVRMIESLVAKEDTFQVRQRFDEELEKYVQQRIQEHDSQKIPKETV